MTNYFYIDEHGRRQGPISDQQLKALAARGTIKPHTPLETDSGHKGTAEQIPGLNFNTVAPSTVPQKTDSPYTPQNGNSTGASIISWLTDFAFKDLRLPVINLLACRIIYAICCITAILWGLFATFMFISIAAGPYGDATAIVFGIPLAWLGAAVFVFLARLFCEWYIIIFDWIIETTKAARKINNE